MIYPHKRWIFSHPIEWIRYPTIFLVVVFLFCMIFVIRRHIKVWRTFHSKYLWIYCFSMNKRKVLFSFLSSVWVFLWRNNNLVNHCMLNAQRRQQKISLLLWFLTLFFIFHLKLLNHFRKLKIFFINYPLFVWTGVREGNDSLCLRHLHVFEIHYILRL